MPLTNNPNARPINYNVPGSVLFGGGSYSEGSRPVSSTVGGQTFSYAPSSGGSGYAASPQEKTAGQILEEAKKKSLSLEQTRQLALQSSSAKAVETKMNQPYYQSITPKFNTASEIIKAARESPITPYNELTSQYAYAMTSPQAQKVEAQLEAERKYQNFISKSFPYNDIARAKYGGYSVVLTKSEPQPTPEVKKTFFSELQNDLITLNEQVSQQTTKKILPSTESAFPEKESQTTPIWYLKQKVKEFNERMPKEFNPPMIKYAPATEELLYGTAKGIYKSVRDEPITTIGLSGLYGFGTAKAAKYIARQPGGREVLEKGGYLLGGLYGYQKIGEGIKGYSEKGFEGIGIATGKTAVELGSFAGGLYAAKGISITPAINKVSNIAKEFKTDFVTEFKNTFVSKPQNKELYKNIISKEGIGSITDFKYTPELKMSNKELRRQFYYGEPRLYTKVNIVQGKPIIELKYPSTKSANRIQPFEITESGMFPSVNRRLILQQKYSELIKKKNTKFTESGLPLELERLRYKNPELQSEINRFQTYQNEKLISIPRIIKKNRPLKLYENKKPTFNKEFENKTDKSSLIQILKEPETKTRTEQKLSLKKETTQLIKEDTAQKQKSIIITTPRNFKIISGTSLSTQKQIPRQSSVQMFKLKQESIQKPIQLIDQKQKQELIQVPKQRLNTFQSMGISELFRQSQELKTKQLQKQNVAVELFSENIFKKNKPFTKLSSIEFGFNKKQFQSFSKPKRQVKRYTPSAYASLLGITAKRKDIAGELSGLGVRPIVR